MLQKIISIKNLGRFKKYAATGNTQLKKHVLILGANGYGKSTLCAMLRSLNSADTTHVVGRRTLGVDDHPEIHLLSHEGKSIRFGKSGWNEPLPLISIFDNTYLAENVHSGEVVDLEHKRNLYRVIIGSEGVSLAEEESRVANSIRSLNSELSTLQKVLQVHCGPQISVKDFVALQAEDFIDQKIADQRKVVEALLQCEQIKNRPALKQLEVPTLPNGVHEVLCATIENIGSDIELQVHEHLKRHQMSEAGQAWISEGLPFIVDDCCPFCDQQLQSAPLITAYKAMFSDAYTNLKLRISALSDELSHTLGDGIIGRINTAIASNAAALEFWSAYCNLEQQGALPDVEVTSPIVAVRSVLSSLLKQKHAAPLERIDCNEDLETQAALKRFVELQRRLHSVNQAIDCVNEIIKEKKSDIENADVKTAQAALANLMSIKKKSDAAVASQCELYRTLVSQKEELEKDKASIRTKLESHTKAVVGPYQERINELLDDFNADFEIAETKHAYPGGVATSSYQLRINKTSVDLGDSKTGLEKPSFKNTLSAGDKNTLGLAFFIAHLERDPLLPNRIVVFDDPFNSQDAYRKQSTISQIKQISEKCTQVVVMSHDPKFLRQVSEKVPVDQQTILQILDSGEKGSTIHECDLNDHCDNRVESEVKDLKAFHDTGAGAPRDIIRKMRVVLETYCRTTFPVHFAGIKTLGAIVEKIAKDGEVNPACHLLKKLDEINTYSREHHHGETPSCEADVIDTRELKGYVKKTLKITNHWQAGI